MPTPRPYPTWTLLLMIVGGTAFLILVPAALIGILGRSVVGDRPALAFGSFFGCFAVFVASLIWFIVSSDARDRGWITAAMTSLGLSVTDHGDGGLRGSGVNIDRPLEVVWTPHKRGQANALTVMAGCRAPIRLRVRQRSWLSPWLGQWVDADLLRREPRYAVDPGDPALAGLRIRSDRVDWGHAILADADGRRALLRLAELTRGRSIDLELEGGFLRCWSKSPPVLEITRERVELALTAASALAAAAERGAVSMLPGSSGGDVRWQSR